MKTVLAIVDDKPVVFKSFIYSESLLYALKALSGDSENDIINYFYEIGIKLFLDSISKKKRPKRTMRAIKLFYKQTNLMAKFEVHTGFYAATYDTNIVSLTMELKFLSDMRHISGSQLLGTLTEVNLLLSDAQIVNIEKPSENVYKCMKQR